MRIKQFFTLVLAIAIVLSVGTGIAFANPSSAADTVVYLDDIKALAQPGELTKAAVAAPFEYIENGMYSAQLRAPNVYHIHDQTIDRPATSETNPASMHLVVGENKAVLFDAGNRKTNQENYENWREDLVELVDYLRGDKPLELVITHNHGDHIGQVDAFPDIAVYMPRDDYSNPDPGRYTLIDEGWKLDIGGYVFESMYLKGHTKGSMVFIDEEHRLVVTGDAMGSAHIWLFNPADAATWVAQAERFMQRVGEWDDAVLMLGHDWQRWEHPEKNDTLSMQFFRDMLQAGKDLLDNKLIGTEYAPMQGQAPRFAYEFNASQGPDRAAYIDIPIPRGVNPITFKASDWKNSDYIALKQSVPGDSDVYLIHDGNIQSMYLIMNETEALLIDTSNPYGGLADFIYNIIGDRKLSLYITHEHGDHVGNVREFSNIDLYLPKNANMRTLDDEIENNNLNPILIGDGETFTIAGRTFELYEMDGHTNNGGVLIDRENRIMFVGDALGTQTTTGGGWVNNGDPEIALAEYKRFKEVFDGTYDRVYTGHNAFWADTNYINNMIAACQYLVDLGIDATVYNVGQNRPSALQVMVTNGELRKDDAAEFGNPGTLTFAEEHGSASLDLAQNFLLNYDVKKYETAIKPEGWTHNYYADATAAAALRGGKNDAFGENSQKKHDAMVNLEALLKSLDKVNEIHTHLGYYAETAPEDYTQASYAAFKDAALAAEAVYNNPAAAPQAITDAGAALSAAFAALVEAEPSNPLLTIENYGMEGSKAYVYKPETMYAPPPMLTDILYVYADSGFSTETEAWDYINGIGLVELADEKQSVIVVMNPIGDAWGADDVTVYQGFFRYLYWDPIPGETAEESAARLEAGGRITWGQNMYVFSEKSGATFVNQYLSQAANKIGVVVTVGGEMPEGVGKPMALPAYIANGSQAAIDHYKDLNEVNSEETVNGKQIFRNNEKDLQAVVVNSAATELNAEVVRDAWNLLIGRTVRQSLDANPWSDWASSSIHTLTERPDYLSMDLTRLNVGYEWTGVNQGPGWFEWVPNEFFDGSDGGKKYPLIIANHGSSDHPIYEAEANGWINVAGEERLIVAASMTSTPEFIHAMIDELVEKYPIDESRIYIAGFSLGSGTTVNAAAYDHPEYGRFKRFAGMAPMSGRAFPEGMPEGVKIPYFATYGGREVFSQAHLEALAYNGAVLPEDGAIDPFMGIPVTEREVLTNNVRDIIASAYYTEDGTPLVKFGYGYQIAHAHFVPYGVAIYDYFKQFARDLETGEIIYTPNTNQVRLNAESNVVAQQGELTVTVGMSVENLSQTDAIAGVFKSRDDRFDISVSSAYDGANVEYNGATGKFVIYKAGGFDDFAGRIDMMEITLTLKDGAVLAKGQTVNTILESIEFEYAVGGGSFETFTTDSSILNGSTSTAVWLKSDVLGDINRDGKVTISDVVIALNRYGKLIDDADWFESGAYDIDLDESGLIDMTDISAIVKLSVQ